MRIKDYTDMVRHLTDSFNIPEARRMIEENPALTQEQFKMAGLSESFPGTFTSYNDAVSEGFQGTREEWLQQQSIPQIERPLTGAAGGRVDLKPGGIVEPGVTHYARKTSHERATINRKKLTQWLGNKKSVDWATYKKAIERIFDQPVASITTKLRERYPEILKGVKFTDLPPGSSDFYEATRLTLREAENIRKTLPKNILLQPQSYKHGEPSGIYQYILKITGKEKTKGGVLRVTKAYSMDEKINTKSLKELTDIRDKTFKKWYPNTITEKEFKVLRLKKENRKLSLDDFAKKLGNKTTKYGGKFNSSHIYELQKITGINDRVGVFTHRTIPEVKEIIREGSEGADYILKRYKDGFITDSALKKLAQGVLKTQDLESRTGRFPFTGTKEGKKWNDLFRAANTDDRIKIVGEFADPENYPREADGKINWKKVDKNKVPAWKRVKFVDTESPKPRHRFIYHNLSSQVDDVFGKGSWNKSTQVYDEIKRLNLLELPDGRKISGVLNVELAKRDLRNKLTKEAGKPVSQARFDREWKTYAKGKMKGYSFMQGHHPFGVGKNPWVVEIAFRDANLKLQNLDEALKAKTLPFKEYIKQAKVLPGGIRFPHPESGKIIGPRGTGKSIFTAAGKEANLSRKILRSFDNIGKDIKTWDTSTLTIFGKKTGCLKKGEGGSLITCLQKKLVKEPEKFAEISSSLAGSKNAKIAKNSFNLARKLMTVGKFTGWGLIGEAVFAPLIALPMWAKGTPKDEIIDMLTYGAFGQDREEKIHEKLSPLGRAYVKTQELNIKGTDLIEQFNAASEQGYQRQVIGHELRALEKEYDQVTSIFTADPITGDPNQDLINKAAQEVDDVTKYFEDIVSGSQKERASWLAPKTSKVMETIIDKPGKAFIDFTLGPNWKENLPEQQNQFYKKRYPRNPRELGQHLSYGPDIPMFAEGGIMSLKK
jgi:hypothetical protein